MNIKDYDLHFNKADVYYIPNFIETATATEYMSKLLNEITLEKREREGRLTALHGSAAKYTYALNNEAVPKPWTDTLISIKDKIEGLLPEKTYDVCLLNYYKNGHEGFNFHADREEIGNPIPIASISLGAERKFYFRNKSDTNPDEEVQSIVLAHGSLLIMDLGTHENYIHGLPRDSKIKTPRLNLTFRKTRN
jgi:alkylated DNA repair dioxygenase AlkB